MERCVCQPCDHVAAHPFPVFTLAAYRHGTVAERLVLAAKRQSSKELFGFLADELAARLRDNGVRGGRHTVITYVPRNPRNRRREGQDQGLLLARALAARMESTVMCGFENHGFRSQKNLHKEARALHPARVYRARDELASVYGKTVIVLDDVCTTGGSLNACYAKLRQAGAARVVCATLAKTGC